MSDDKLMVQISLSINAPEGVRFSKKVLQEIMERVIAGKKIPDSVTVRGIFWRNPNRTGNLGAWRYHEEADLEGAPTPRESRPRGTLQDAIETLAPFLERGEITF